MTRMIEILLAFLLGIMFAFLCLYAMTEPLQAPTKQVIRVEA